jgi:hypothetical protein
MLDMQQHVVIKESESPWSSPIVPIWKKNGDLRFRVEYRKLNDVTGKDFCTARIDDTLNTVARARRFSTLDLKSGYWQVDLHPDKKKSAFAAGQGLWQFTIMPFGLCNPPVTFEGFMETIVRGIITHVSCTWTT